MNIIKNRVSDVTVLDIQGVIKLGESAREFSSYLEKVLNDETGPVMINFEAINYMDSTGRSEEHTSELQSQSNLVCRLLLEKKKTRQSQRTHFLPVALAAESRTPCSLASQPCDIHCPKRSVTHLASPDSAVHDEYQP